MYSAGVKRRRGGGYRADPRAGNMGLSREEEKENNGDVFCR